MCPRAPRDEHPAGIPDLAAATPVPALEKRRRRREDKPEGNKWTLSGLLRGCRWRFERMVVDSSERTEVWIDCENLVGKNLANGHPVDASEQETLYPQGIPRMGDICAKGNKWKWSTIGLLVLLVPSVIANIYLGVILYQVTAAPCPSDATLPSLDASPCPRGWVTNEGWCYFFSDIEQNWTASQNNCSSQGGSLLAMDTPQERGFVLGPQHPTYFWLDFRREGVGEPWKYSNGSLFNNRFPILGEGLCSYMNERNASSTYCDNNRHWICVKPVRGH